MRKIQVNTKDISKFAKEVKRINNKAAKLGLPVTMVTWEDKVHHRLLKNTFGDYVPFSYYEAEVHGEDFFLKLGDHYRLVARLEKFGDFMLVYSKQDIDIASVYGKSESYCDHCRTKRRRKKTYVIENTETGEFIQVGSTCMKDFVGNASVDQRLSLWDEWTKLRENYEEIMNTEKDHEGTSYGSGSYASFKVEEFLKVVSILIHTSGWVSKSFGWDTGQTPTAVRAQEALELGADSRKYCLEHEELKVLQPEIDQALAWIRSEEPTSDYMHNLKTVASADVVYSEHLGILASLIPAYRRFVREESIKEVKVKESNYVGEVGKRQVFENLTLLHVVEAESFYGISFGHKFIDSEGNILFWWTGSKSLEARLGKDKPFTVKATVKEHKTYQGNKQTVLTRLKLEHYG